MASVTIPVSAELGARLRAQAERAGVTLERHLERLAELDEQCADRLRARAARCREMRESIARTSPEDMASYLEETEAWERTEWADAVD